MVESTTIAWIVGAIVVLAILFFVALLLLVAGGLAIRYVMKKSKAVGIDLTDGINAHELQLVKDLFTKQKVAEIHQSTAATMQAAAGNVLPSDQAG